MLPINYEVLTISADFTDSAELQTVVCDGLCGDITYLASQFTFNSYALPLGGCEAAVNSSFQNVHFSVFFENDIISPFLYAITDKINGSKTLVVTNASGDETIYGSVLLSRQAFATPLVSTYPNPVKETLFVTTNPNSGYVTIAILNNLGKHVLSLKSSELNQTVINVES
ncbi:T9SS type A sorting domain-containing protein [Bizionia saleffrena]|uniref:T9SS type A sorting domain-containing protein n=1 Tax=Bizionia saleffrena TaxID=291189 RepID=A0A8H2LPJ1_9FLAO|nr:T9SS type A sorting domain-containing protein [Bizionia saleffrena]TYB78175.1 T9SS type A sorting domain-containing protein [Bizionia saleffrena]